LHIVHDNPDSLDWRSVDGALDGQRDSATEEGGSGGIDGNKGEVTAFEAIDGDKEGRIEVTAENVASDTEETGLGEGAKGMGLREGLGAEDDNLPPFLFDEEGSRSDGRRRRKGSSASSGLGSVGEGCARSGRACSITSTEKGFSGIFSSTAARRVLRTAMEPVSSLKGTVNHSGA
jgi:hypothetical protein